MEYSTFINTIASNDIVLAVVGLRDTDEICKIFYTHDNTVRYGLTMSDIYSTLHVYPCGLYLPITYTFITIRSNSMKFTPRCDGILVVLSNPLLSNTDIREAIVRIRHRNTCGEYKRFPVILAYTAESIPNDVLDDMCTMKYEYFMTHSTRILPLIYNYIYGMQDHVYPILDSECYLQMDVRYNGIDDDIFKDYLYKQEYIEHDIVVEYYDDEYTTMNITTMITVYIPLVLT